MYARRIDKNDLRRGMFALHCVDFQHAMDAVACGLRLARNNGDFLADQRIHQCGLAGIRPAKDQKQIQNVEAYPLVSTNAVRAIGVAGWWRAFFSPSGRGIHDKIDSREDGDQSRVNVLLWNVMLRGLGVEAGEGLGGRARAQVKPSHISKARCGAPDVRCEPLA